jgi:hypothetical protein
MAERLVGQMGLAPGPVRGEGVVDGSDGDDAREQAGRTRKAGVAASAELPVVIEDRHDLREHGPRDPLREEELDAAQGVLLDDGALAGVEGPLLLADRGGRAAEADVVEDRGHPQVGQLDLAQADLLPYCDGEDGGVGGVVRGVGLPGLDGGDAEEGVVVLEADVDQGVDRPRDLLREVVPAARARVLLGEEAPVQDHELRVGEEGVAPPLQHGLGAARAAPRPQRLVDPERQAGGLQLGFEGREPALLGGRVDQDAEELADTLGVEGAVDDEAPHAALLEEVAGVVDDLELLAREPQLHGVEEESPVLGLQGDAPLGGDGAPDHLDEVLDGADERLVLYFVDLGCLEELEPGVEEGVGAVPGRIGLAADLEPEVVDGDPLRGRLGAASRRRGVAHRPRPAPGSRPATVSPVSVPALATLSITLLAISPSFPPPAAWALTSARLAPPQAARPWRATSADS